MEDTDLGIYCVETKTFYYLESGNVKVYNTVDRIRTTLTRRGVMTIARDGTLDSANYPILTVREAKIRDYKMEPIFLSDHVRKLVESGLLKKSDGPWV
jgi:hypothetical protein